MKVFPLFSFLFSIALIGTLGGCGGGSGRSGDDGGSSLRGRTAVLVEEGTALFSLRFTGRDVNITRMGNMFEYKGVYAYAVRPDRHSAILDIKSGADGDTYCTMRDVLIVFDDAECNSGSIVSGTCTEFGPHLDPKVQGEPQPMGGWILDLSQN